MDKQRFVQLSLLAFALVIASFVVLGFARLLLPFETAQTIAAPIGIAGFALVAYLTLRAAGAALGIAPIPDRE